MEEKKENNNSFLKRYDTVIAFLSLEIVALALFGLGGTTGLSIFRALGIVVTVLIFPFISAHHQKEELMQMGIALIPAAFLFLLLAFSRFWVGYYGSVFTSLVNSLLLFLSLVSFFLIGYGVKQIASLKRDVILLTIGSALGLFVLITGLYSLARYGFFYASIYANKVYYYDGVIFQIASETKYLSGFSFVEVSLRYGKVAAFVLACSGISVFGVDFKKQWKRGLIFIAFALLGILDLAVVPYKIPLIFLAFIYGLGFILFLLFRLLKPKDDAALEKRNRIAKIVYLVFVIFISVLVFLFVLDAILGHRIIPTSRGFGEGSFFGTMQEEINLTFFSKGADDIRRFDFFSLLFGASSSRVSLSTFSRSFEFNVLLENGVLAFLLLLYCIFRMVRKSWVFLQKDESSLDGKFALVGMLVGLFFYLSLFADEMPYRHDVIFTPFTHSNWLIALVFLSGLIWTSEAKAKKIEEAIQ